MLIFRGLCQALLGGMGSVGPLPDDFKALSSGFIPDLIGPLTLVPPIVNAAGKTIVGSGIVLHMTTIVIGVVGVLAYIFAGFNARRTRDAPRPHATSRSRCSRSRRVVVSALGLFLVYQFATYKGLPIVLIVMSVLIGALHVRHQEDDHRPPRLRDGRQHQGGAAVGHQDRAADAPGVHQHGRAVGARRPHHRGAPQGQAVPAAGLGSELDVIAAVFIGGASAMGGVGQVVGTVVGGFIMGVMNNGMSIIGVNIDWQQVVKGLVLLGAVVFDVYNKNKG